MPSLAPIAIAGLNHHFGKGSLRKQVLYDVDVEIPQGEIVIVTGPSGSGKTTLLTLVGALRSAQEGSIRVLGTELRNAKASDLETVRKQIGFIFQQHNLLAALSAVQNVELGLRVAGYHAPAARHRAALAMLEAVGMGHRAHYKAGQLSGGQRQRVAIARALAASPKMLLADEPTASLDKASGREVVDRMRTLAREQGCTILLVTHDNRILDIADRIVHLEDGRLSSFTDSVLANTSHMMRMLADNRQKQDIGAEVDAMDEAAFRTRLHDINDEAVRFLDATALANDGVFQAMLEQSLFAVTRKLAQLLDAERSSLFLVDHASQTLLLRVTEGLAGRQEIRIPIGSGIAGAVAASGRGERIADAYEDPRFNRDVDRTFGYRTRSILCLPLFDRQGRVFAVAQLLNRRDGLPFDAGDEAALAGLLVSIAPVLEGLQAGRRDPSATAGSDAAPAPVEGARVEPA
jgi:putative ABC transport system ATP-binding protein